MQCKPSIELLKVRDCAVLVERDGHVALIPSLEELGTIVLHADGSRRGKSSDQVVRQVDEGSKKGSGRNLTLPCLKHVS